MAKIKVFIAPSNGLSLPELGHFRHGEHELELTSAQVAQLESDDAEGVSIVKSGSQAPSSEAIRPVSDVDLSAAIVAAVAQLDQTNAALWTQAAGVPTTAALSNALGYPVTASERDAALLAV